MIRSTTHVRSAGSGFPPSPAAVLQLRRPLSINCASGGDEAVALRMMRVMRCCCVRWPSTHLAATYGVDPLTSLVAQMSCFGVAFHDRSG